MVNGGFLTAGSDKFWIGLNDTGESVSGVFGNVPVTDIPNNAGTFTSGGIDYTVYYGADFATDALTGGNDILVIIPELGSAALLLTVRRSAK